VLAPTDPVLASDVGVGGPTTGDEEIGEDDEVRFALTSEAGFNDSLAFPFVYAAILMAGAGGVAEWGPRWLLWVAVGKVVIGAVLGVAVGWLLARAAFHFPRPSIRMAETGDPLFALAALLLSYGVAQVAGGYGFLAVFSCAMTIRSAERSHDYHALMHDLIERLERLFTLVVLLLLGVALTGGLLHALNWQAAAFGVLYIMVVRPLTAWFAMRVAHRRSGRPNDLGPRETLTTAFFGIRGVGSIYYLAYATGEESFPHHDTLWSTLAFVIVLSVVIHGVAATPVMQWIERRRADAAG
jgi:NhaP-type Na+/H+ or K+/H+ antiporter